MGRFEDWCFALSGDAVFGGWRLLNFDFDFDFGAMGLFDYSGGVVAFEEGYLEAVREFDKIHKHTGGFGLLNLSQTDYAQVLTAGSELDPCLMKGSKLEVLHQQN